MVKPLKDLREEIDQLDAEIVRHVVKRLAVVGEIAHTKLVEGREIYDPAREEALAEKIGALARDKAASVQMLYRTMTAVSRAEEHNAYRGGCSTLPAGTYTVRVKTERGLSDIMLMLVVNNVPPTSFCFSGTELVLSVSCSLPRGFVNDMLEHGFILIGEQNGGE